MESQSIVMHGQVEYVEGTDGLQYSDDANAGRIKVRLDSDGKNKSSQSLVYAFPLLPKVFQSTPKVGEGVFVLTERIGDNESQRFYIGPIISQPQFHEKCEYKSGNGDAVSLLSSGKAKKNQPLTAIYRDRSETKGSFPDPQDVAIIGRGQEDIILKYRKQGENDVNTSSEIDLRAGIKIEPTNTKIKYIKGNVLFNDDSPAYIQVKYKKNGITGIKDGTGDRDSTKYESKTVREGKSVVNVVADKINLISHKDLNHTKESITNRDTLVDEAEIDNIMSNLHRAVYGDELITLLKLIVNALKTHTHPMSMKPPVIAGTDMMYLDAYSYENIISPNVRIS